MLAPLIRRKGREVLAFSTLWCHSCQAYRQFNTLAAWFHCETCQRCYSCQRPRSEKCEACQLFVEFKKAMTVRRPVTTIGERDRKAE